MKRNLKLMALFMIAIFATTMLFGCGLKPKDAMFNAIKKNQQVKSYKVKGSITLEAKDNKEIQSAGFNNAKVTWDGIVQQKPQKAILNFVFEVQDVSFKGNLYINNDKMYMKLPSMIIPQHKYMEFNLKNTEKKDKKSSDKNEEKLASQLIYEIFNSIAQDKFKEVGTKEINGDKLRLARTELSQSDLKILLKNTANIVNKAKYKKLFNSGKNNFQADLKKSINDAANNMDKNVKLEKFQFNVAIDNEGYAKNEAFILNLKSKKDSSSIKISISNTFSDINKTPKFNFPAFNKNNTIPYDHYSPFFGLPGHSQGPNQVPDYFALQNPDYSGLTQPL